MKGRSQPFPSLSFLFVFVLWVSWFPWTAIADKHGLGCRTLRFVKPVEGFALLGHLIKNISLQVPYDDVLFSQCRSLCGMESTCVSINIGLSGNDGVSMCQLSNSDHMRHPDDLKPQEGFLYWATRNPCSSNPCLHNDTCLNGFTDKRYICLCQGYTGEHCETELDECQTNSHTCDVNAYCINTAGSYSCKCKAGYTGDGKICNDVDECAIENDYCHAYQICNNTEGSFTCTCRNGSSGSNLTAFCAVFTNIGATERFGPTLLGSHYSGQDHDGQVTLTSGIQQWIVPYTGEYRIEAIGAAGGYDAHTNSEHYRGRGARMIGTFSLSKDEIIHILVGQEGGINSRGLSSGGGGGTFVVRGSNSSLLVAGGGGGIREVQSRHAGCDANTNTTGNPGYRSWTGGSNGHGAQTSKFGWAGGGGGGFYSSGRSGKQFNGTMGTGGEGGKGFLQGGVGGRAWMNNAIGGFGGGGGASAWQYGAGGGGGGYSGGSSGDDKPDSCGGGGGSFNNGTNQQNECCYNTAGHGQVTIIFL